MDDNSFTAKLTEEDETQLPSEIRNSIALLRERFSDQPIKVLKWHDDWIAATLVVDVELPGRGPVGGVDIRKREPIALMFNRHIFPHRAPLVYSNRRDFPKSKFPHVNVTALKQPAWLCLHRGSVDAWFAEHDVYDLVQRARGWFRDAARDRLVPEGDGFELTRAAETRGTIVYEPKVNLDRIAKNWELAGGAANYGLIAFDLLDEDSRAEIGESGFSVRQAADVESYVYKEHLELAEILNDLAGRPESKGQFQHRLFGVLVWADERATSREYFGELPATLGELVVWANDLGLPLSTALADFLSNGFHLFAGVPVIVAVKRPRDIIGTDSPIELLNFLVTAGGDHWPSDGSWNIEAATRLSDHRTPLTPSFAQKISAITPESSAQPSLLFGAGALGSKVATHLARSGIVDLKIFDWGKMSPHNLVRHALGGGSIGKPKAEALKDELLKLYPGQKGLPIEVSEASALIALREANFADGYRNLIDLTASNVVLNAIRDAELPGTLRVHRAEIAHRGRLGLLTIEGRDRNPRIDDLQTLIYDSAIDDDAVAAWLEEVKSTRDDQVGSNGLEDIQVGLSCSSATMRLADEVVSFHAAAVTRRLRPYLAIDGRNRAGGVIYKSYLGDDGDSRASTQTFAATVVVAADAGWQIRIAAGAAEMMSTLLHQHSPNETGGILVGRIAAPRKTIYVTRLVPAPPDSRGTPWIFTRGTRELPEALEKVHRRTGGLMTYVGEWHTHPMGGSDLSETDKGAVISLRSILDDVGRPTLVTIVTPDEIRPHLFESTSPPVVLDPPRRRFGIIRVMLGWRR